MQRTSEAFTEFLRQGPIHPGPKTGLGRIEKNQQIVHAPDVTAELPYIEKDPLRIATADLGGARTFLAVPMLIDTILIGAFTIYRLEVKPFSEEQIRFVGQFANQAAIAAENARLLGELRALNENLEERVTEQIEKLRRAEILRRFLSPQIAEIILSQGDIDSLKSHRKKVAIVFCDLRGFTAFSEIAEPEEVMEVLRDYHEALGKLIFSYQGTVERFAGDGVMVIFNDPVPCERPVESAVRMALDIHETVNNLSTHWRRMDFDLGLGVGIANGFATLGRIGFEGRYDYAAIGSVTNLASRLCEAAEDGEILISQRALIFVEDIIESEPRGELQLKGFHRPIRAHNVIRIRS
jgi:adenylate cyclase